MYYKRETNWMEAKKKKKKKKKKKEKEVQLERTPRIRKQRVLNTGQSRLKSW